MPLQELLYKERYETVLNEAMRYSMEFDMPDEEINAFISYIGKANKCDRFYIFEDSLTENITVNTYEYCAPGIQPEKNNLQRVDKEALKEHYAIIFLKIVSQKILLLIPMNIVPQAYSQKRTTYKEWIRKL